MRRLHGNVMSILRSVENGWKRMDKELILSYLEMIEETSRLPLYNSLEVGFRHSPLSPKEKLDRYADACAQINQFVQIMIKDLRDDQ
jgi:hypothetical protein